MHSSMIGKIEKARRYADEPWRAKMQSLAVQFQGDNDSHTITYADGNWHCACHFFEANGTCAHVMAVKHMVDRAFDGATVSHEAHLLSSR